jgi:DNA-binding protein HU-beta
MRKEKILVALQFFNYKFPQNLVFKALLLKPCFNLVISIIFKVNMHKTDLIKAIANDSGLSQKDSGLALDSFLKVVTKSLKKGDSVALIGFGTFKVVKREARKGRNPKTGKEMQIKASKAIRFSVGKSLKDSVQ